MSTGTLVAIEMALLLGGVLVFGIYQLVSVRRDLARDRAARGSTDPSRKDTESAAGTGRGEGDAGSAGQAGEDRIGSRSEGVGAGVGDGASGRAVPPR